jgi:hypothetical protein
MHHQRQDTVCPTGCSFSTIKSAVESTSLVDGDTVSLTANSYTTDQFMTAFGVKITRSITIRCPTPHHSLVLTARHPLGCMWCALMSRTLTLYGTHGGSAGPGGVVIDSGTWTLWYNVTLTLTGGPFNFVNFVGTTMRPRPQHIMPKS